MATLTDRREVVGCGGLGGVGGGWLWGWERCR